MLDSGELVSDELTTELVQERLSADDTAQASCSMGTEEPRTGGGAGAWLAGGTRPRHHSLLRSRGRHRNRASTGSRVAEGRTDDTPDVIARRLALYHEQTEPVVEHYRATGNLVTLHAVRPIDDGLRRDRLALGDAIEVRRVIIRKGPEEIERIARAGDLSAATIIHVGQALRPGITTGELDRIAEDFIVGRGGIATSKGYPGAVCPFPGAICISRNDVVVHGIPGSTSSPKAIS